MEPFSPRYNRCELLWILTTCHIGGSNNLSQLGINAMQTGPFSLGFKCCELDPSHQGLNGANYYMFWLDSRYMFCSVIAIRYDMKYDLICFVL